MNFTQDFIENDTIFEEMIDNSTIQYEIVNSTDIFSADGSGDLNGKFSSLLNFYNFLSNDRKTAEYALNLGIKILA